ncbi:MAG TPA: response regulator transcription factor [Pyrinomonadaceae bacterium]|nr:response regulator transcription factor [Pyrinomonadaceae bacterium]
MTTQSPSPVRVYVVDDHAIMRRGVKDVLRECEGMECVGEAGERDAALAGAAETRPDVILLDLDLGNVSGIDLIPELRKASPASRVLILTGLSSEAVHLKAFRAGARGLVLKGKAEEELAPAIRKVIADRLWIDPALVESLLDEGADAATGWESDPEATRIKTLKPREMEIISLIGEEGLSNARIAERLFIAEGTVKQHLNNIFEKLGVTDRFALIMYAYRHGLARPPIQKLS